MKKLLTALFLCCCLVLVGCKNNNNPPTPTPQPQPVVPVNPTPVPVPNRITEVDNGKTFAVKNGSTLTFVLTVASSDDYFWAFSQMDGDFEVLSDTRNGNFQTLTVKVNGSGSLGLQYCQFDPSGAKVISQLAFGVQAQ